MQRRILHDVPPLISNMVGIIVGLAGGMGENKTIRLRYEHHSTQRRTKERERRPTAQQSPDTWGRGTMETATYSWSGRLSSDANMTNTGVGMTDHER
jgi:hypothetical protein